MKERLRLSFILLKCFFFYLRRGKANGAPVIPPKVILVVQLAWLGDMVCTTPVFRAIKNKYPECRILVLGAKRNKDLLLGHPDVDKYVEWDEDFETLKKEIALENADFACLATPHFASLAYLYLLGIPVIAAPVIKNGFSPNETKLFKILRRLVLAVSHTMGQYAPREYLKLLEPIGIFSEDTSKHLYFSEKAGENIKNFIRQNVSREDFLVAISPSAGNKMKNWGSARFALVADHLIEKYKAKVFVIGSKMDEKEVSDMISASKHPSGIINTIGRFPLDELKAFISNMDLFISVDTGPIYIAEAFNVPTIDIIGPVDENEQPPRGEMNANVIAPDRKRPLTYVMNARVFDPKLVRESIDGITPDMVFAAIAVLYPKIIKRKNNYENISFVR